MYENLDFCKWLYEIKPNIIDCNDIISMVTSLMNVKSEQTLWLIVKLNEEQLLKIFLNFCRGRNISTLRDCMWFYDKIPNISNHTFKIYEACLHYGNGHICDWLMTVKSLQFDDTCDALYKHFCNNGRQEPILWFMNNNLKYKYSIKSNGKIRPIILK